MFLPQGTAGCRLSPHSGQGDCGLVLRAWMGAVAWRVGPGKVWTTLAISRAL